MKVWNYSVIALGMILIMFMLNINVGSQSQIFNVTGIRVNETSGEITSVETSAASVFESLFSSTGGILTGLAIATGVIVAGFLSRTKGENFIILLFIIETLALFISVFIAAITHAISLGQAWVSWIAVLILVPFTYGYVIALLEFFRGSD